MPQQQRDHVRILPLLLEPMAKKCRRSWKRIFRRPASARAMGRPEVDRTSRQA
jgi:hypothetical protein